MQKTVAVLAVQGAFAEHESRLRALGCSVIELRQLADLQQPFDGLVLPGGESTTQAKLLHDLGMLEPLRQRIQDGLPVLGTCAGLILLAESVQSASDGRQLKTCGDGDTRWPTEADPSSHNPSAESKVAPPNSPMQVHGFATLPVTVVRNGYGRQLGSFTATAPLHVKHGEGNAAPSIPLTFIRAPRITATGEGVDTLVALNGEPVAVRYKNQIGCCFHPELNEDNHLYELFLNLI